MPQRGEKPVSLEEYATQLGISLITKAHPQFRGSEEYILNHIDKKGLEEKIEAIQKNINPNLSPTKINEYLTKEISDYVASGSFLDSLGQQTILGKGLEGKTNFLSKLFSGSKTTGQKYLTNTINAFREMYSLLKTGDYAQHMPELAQAAVTINNMGFLNSAIDTLAYHGMMSKRKYTALKKSLREGITETSKGAMGMIEQYLTPQAAPATQVAAVFGIVGLLLIIFSGIELTGASIGAITQPTTGLITGIVSSVISGVLFLKRRFA